MKSLKLLLKETLLREIFRDPRRPRKQNASSFIDNQTGNVDGSSESPFSWAVLVVDTSTLGILQSCFQTHELTSENIACIEMLHNSKRSPAPLHAIYFLSVVQDTEHKVFKILTDDFGGSKKPSEYSVQTICAAVMNEKNKSAKSKLKTLFNDIFSFSSTAGDLEDNIKPHHEDPDDYLIKKAIKNFRKYSSATCYFSRPYNETYRAEFEDCIGAEKYNIVIRCFKVLESCCFVPVSSNAFTLKMEDAITNIYFARNEKQRAEFFKLMSEKLGNVWGMFGQYPTILVRKASTENSELAYKVQMQLEKNSQVFRSIRPPISQSSSGTLLDGDSSLLGGDDSAKLIIMDRGMDLKTPLMHDLTFLPLIYDVLQTEGDFYLGNQEPKHHGSPGGNNTTLKNSRRENTIQEDSSEVNTQKANGGLRPKSKRAKRDTKIEMEPTPGKVEARQEGAKHIPEQNQVCLTSEEDSKWRKMRYLPLTQVLEHFEEEHKKELRKANNAEKTAGVAEGYSEIINPLKKHLEDCIKSLEDVDPEKYFKARIVTQISSQIKSTTEGLDEMVLNSIAGTDNCFLKQACAHLKQTQKSLESMVESKALVHDKSNTSTQAQNVKGMDSKKKKIRRKSKEEAIPLKPKASQNVELRKLDEISNVKNQKYSDLNVICQMFIEDLLKLIDRLDHIGERIKTEDVYQRQMELALTIHRLVSQKKVEYMKNVYVHLAVECLEQLRVRELYEVFPLENELFANFPKEEKKKGSYINIISASSSTQLENKVLAILESKQKSFTRADKLRLVALTALSCGGLDQNVFKNFLLAAGLIDNRIKAKFETHSSQRRNSSQLASHIGDSNNSIVTDIKKANVEIILGLRKLGGQILKTDPPSQSEIIERAALRNEEDRKLGRIVTMESPGTRHKDMMKIGRMALPRRVSLDPSSIQPKVGFSIRKKSVGLISMITDMVTPNTSPKPERAYFSSIEEERQTEKSEEVDLQRSSTCGAKTDTNPNNEDGLLQSYVPLVAQIASCIIDTSNGNNDLIGQESDILIQKCFRVLKRRGQSWNNSSLNLTRDEVAPNRRSLQVSESGKKIVQSKTLDTLKIPSMGSKNQNKSSPDIYDELLPKSVSKDQTPSIPDTYIQNLKRIREHHQVIMIFVIGGITHSEIKHIYDLQQRHYPSKTILIGSTHVIKPTKFLQEIQNGVNQLNPLTDYSDISVD